MQPLPHFRENRGTIFPGDDSFCKEGECILLEVGVYVSERGDILFEEEILLQ